MCLIHAVVSHLCFHDWAGSYSQGAPSEPHLLCLIKEVAEYVSGKLTYTNPALRLSTLMKGAGLIFVKIVVVLQGGKLGLWDICGFVEQVLACI